MSNMFGAGGHGGGGGEQHGGADGTVLCYFHPRELLVGVCAHCLRERLLLLLAAKSNNVNGRARPPADGASYLSARPYCRALRRRTGSISSSLPKVFALGSFLQRLDSSRHHHHHHHPDEVVHDHDLAGEDKDTDADDATSVASLDDSFISIKFEDNGKATWVDSQNGTGAKPVREAAAATTTTTKTTALVVEHAGRRGGVTRWRKQVVGRLLQLARWKRASGKQSSSSAAADQRSKARVGGGGGRGWIRSLTRRRTAHGERAWS
ncbi:hypothetical protein D1007_12640 [Hordeum vulgare]|uniref:Predicted protein n=1 Tax=Hordeum vulgare subsp. vulgare TaxID=112509 RepID=F2CTB7_HORVV|nr:uncharacterized protein LOC123431331 [Hordeum vulgare subsp. vulgare]KAE8810436.1 hypothetical protein D1007_12640 [Hordeum vulgare]BAJ86088.1 predicted protein [Hordeum vulgare subsp. vulgare]BAJ87058.1 predicted protein [Hordeum vulgare subsp. vulgare]